MINVRRARRVLRYIEEDMRRLDMETVLRFDADVIESYTKRRRPACNTVACYAGWSVFLFDKPFAKKMRQYFESPTVIDGNFDWEAVQPRARRLLGLTGAEARTLFYRTNWDTDLANRDLDTPKDEFMALREQVERMIARQKAVRG